MVIGATFIASRVVLVLMALIVEVALTGRWPRDGGYDLWMPMTASRSYHRWETHLDLLREHSTLGPAIRFYFRRREQLLYLVVGGWNTVFGYGVWAVMQYVLGDHLHYLVIVVVSWPIAVLNAYLGYRFIVFRSRGPISRELPRFAVVYAATLLVNLALLPIALGVFPFSIYVIQAVFTGLVVVLSYLANKFFSFGGRASSDGDGSTPYAASVERGN